MKRLVGYVNAQVVVVVLAVFYLVVIGISWVIFQLATFFKKQKKREDSYWQKPAVEKAHEKYYQTPY